MARCTLLTAMAIGLLSIARFVFGQTGDPLTAHRDGHVDITIAERIQIPDTSASGHSTMAILPFYSPGIDYMSSETAELLLRQEVGKLTAMEIISEKVTAQSVTGGPCRDVACAVEIGEALGVDELLLGCGEHGLRRVDKAVKAADVQLPRLHHQLPQLAELRLPLSSLPEAVLGEALVALLGPLGDPAAVLLDGVHHKLLPLLPPELVDEGPGVCEVEEGEPVGHNLHLVLGLAEGDHLFLQIGHLAFTPFTNWLHRPNLNPMSL